MFGSVVGLNDFCWIHFTVPLLALGWLCLYQDVLLADARVVDSVYILKGDVERRSPIYFSIMMPVIVL